MNARVLGRLRRALAPAQLSAADEYSFLRNELAARLYTSLSGHTAVAAPLSAPLRPFFTHPNVSIPQALHRKINGILDDCSYATEGTPDALTPEIIGLLSETFANARREKGVFYTPRQTAKLLCQETLFAVLTRQAGLSSPQAKRLLDDKPLSAPQIKQFQKLGSFLRTLTVCDPAAGAGGLLVLFALELMALRHKLNPEQNAGELLKEIAAHNLYAGDVDAQALDNLRLRLTLELAARGQTTLAPSAVLPHILTGDALAAQGKQSVWRIAFADVFKQNGGFDAVVSNPPYLGQKNNGVVFERLRQNARWGNLVEPKSDLLYFFFYLALDMLRPGGSAGFLTTPYFATAHGARTLREHLRQQSAFLRLLDFKDERLFTPAPGHHSLLSVFEKSAETGKNPNCQVGETALSQHALYDGEFNYLLTRPPQTVAGPLESLLAKMASCKRTLTDVARITNGLMTGCDRISAAHLKKHRLPGVEKGTGVFVLSQAEKDALGLTRAEEKKLKPFFKNSDVHPYAPCATPGKWLVDFFYPNDRETDLSLYPNLLKHLARFKPVLLARKQNNNGIDKQLKQGNYWFGSVRRRMDFDQEKLAVPHRARQNTFAYSQGPWYASSDVYFISNPATGVTLWYLLALFNSSAYFTWLFYKGKRKGNLLELYSAPLSRLPVPEAPKRLREEMEALAQEIFSQKTKNPQAEVSRQQERLEELVSQLFGFTPHEIQAAAGCRKQNGPVPSKKL